MEFWQDKRNELIGKLPTIMDVLDRLAYGEEKWALEKSPLRMLMPGYIQEECSRSSRDLMARADLFHAAYPSMPIIEEKAVITNLASLLFIARE